MVLGHSNSVTGGHRRAVGVFPTRRAAEQALHELRDSGFAMDRVSIITKDQEHRHDDEIAGVKTHDRTDNQADKGAAVGAASGGVLGGLTGLLVGLGALAIPGIGPIVLAGAAATTIATTVAGGAIGAAAGGLIGALVGLGIPEERARVYNDRVARGEYLVIVDGTNEEIARAETILHHRGIEEYGVYDAPDNTYRRYDEAAPAYVPGSAAVTDREPIRDRGLSEGRGLMGHKRAVGTFAHRHDAEAALTELRDSGFSMDQVSLIAKHTDSTHPIGDRLAGDRLPGDYAGTPTTETVNRNPVTGDYTTGADRRPFAENKADEGAKAGAAGGAALGGLGGLLVGLGALAIPGIGPVVLGGAAATALATAVSGGAIGAAAGGLAGGLTGLGIPENRARAYSDRFERGDYLVMVDGTEDEIRRAETILNRRGIHDWGVFDASDVDATRRTETRHHGTTAL